MTTRKNTRGTLLENCYQQQKCHCESVTIRNESFSASPSCRPRLRLGHQSLGLAQNYLLL
jgi:hypothetical protein